jgi:hypothetical protein
MDIKTKEEYSYVELSKELGKSAYVMNSLTKRLCNKNEFYSKPNKRKFYSHSGANKMRVECGVLTLPKVDEICDAPVPVSFTVAPVEPVVEQKKLVVTGKVVKLAPNIRWAYAKIKECASVILVFVPQKLRGRILNKNVSIKVDNGGTCQTDSGKKYSLI